MYQIAATYKTTYTQLFIPFRRDTYGPFEMSLRNIEAHTETIKKNDLIYHELMLLISVRL